MSSVGNQNPWAPYDNYRDCSQGICSVYCPQFCYLIFPPPPPSDDDSGAHFSPFIIVIIGLLACTVLLVIYYTVVTRYCRRGSAHGTGVEAEQSRDELAQDQWQVAPAGLDEALIKSIAVCKYRKGDGLIEGTECAVCLCEFQENESLRLLPKCRHAFHLPCIDTWLKSQSSCPLCRASVVALAHPSSPPGVDSQDSPGFNLNSYEIQRPNDLILVVEDRERNYHEQMVVITEDSVVRNESVEADQDRTEQLRRSVPFGTFSPQRQLLISDILKFEEINEYVQVESNQLWRGSGSSTGFPMEESKSGTNRSRDGELLRSPVAMKKFTPGGRFIFNAHDKGKNSILPI